MKTCLLCCHNDPESIYRSGPLSTLLVAYVGSLWWYQSDQQKVQNPTRGDMLIARLVGPHACDALYGNFGFVIIGGDTNTINSHLPVQTLLFQCSTCHHGGHQSCYKNHYLRYPMVDLPAPSPPPADDFREQEFSRPALSASSVVDDDSASTVSMQSSTVEVPPFDSPKVSRMIKLKGHPCPAGCGHFCWVASSLNQIDEFWMYDHYVTHPTIFHLDNRKWTLLVPIKYRFIKILLLYYWIMGIMAAAGFKLLMHWTWCPQALPLRLSVLPEWWQSAPQRMSNRSIDQITAKHLSQGRIRRFFHVANVIQSMNRELDRAIQAYLVISTSLPFSHNRNPEGSDH